ncbi:3-hydroxybutyrate dehydrogenase [Gimesia panareensis]|uniref:D-beta-hydroxybutyrate dehydrogenase n=1 Tax=Gimesia panareensis TaxID=2527978 RepID=A0A518A8U5_9PLAN|nr:3-hydroxybutyrate dehydrogenase [Gimesia panareensis]QDT28276.1 D-beta-hydroxybutyrate dehydrogenase [Gimesia panareensis]QDU51147.1 D-beta-hydroxybutyrate dehydrogenase [Gimesia panareensis]QDV19015.1 D-beta-hydroxybutyrate dehydrogenase [Gimesia panareensis]
MTQARVALITGAASGIGAEIAQTLFRDGCDIVIADLHEPDFLADLKADGQRSLFVTTDLSQPAQCQSLVERISQEWGGVEILVNNAGFQHVSPLEDFPEAVWEKMLQVMLTAPFLLTKYVLPGMKQRQWGRIINMGSIHSQVASLNKAGYIAAKHGLVGLTKTTALEGGPFQITANVICPAYVRTPLVEQQIAAQAETLGISVAEVESEVFLKASATGRMIEPAEVASMVSYLCSDKAKSITGACWTIDGGWTAQ